jgi:hypothetical protein
MLNNPRNVDLDQPSDEMLIDQPGISSHLFGGEVFFLMPTESPT